MKSATHFWLGTIRLELSGQHALGDGAALTTVFGQATSPWPGTQRRAPYVRSLTHKTMAWLASTSSIWLRRLLGLFSHA